MARSRLDRSVSARLRRLRIILTLTFTAALATGLVILAAVAIGTDSRSRRQALDAEMSKRVEASSRLIYYSARGQLRLDGLRDDDATTGSPEIRVLREGADGWFEEVFRGRGPHLPLTDGSIAEAARRAIRSESAVRTETTDRTGADAVLIATPFYDDVTGRAAGAVVSATATAESVDDHRRLVVAMVIGCAGLLAVAGGAGWVLAGRSLRPAAAGLAQQEALLADAAHELRNPIASVQSILEGAELDPESRERAIRVALESTRQMGRTVDVLLKRGRVEAGAEGIRRVPLRLDQIVADLLAESGSAEPEPVVSLSAEPTVVYGDPDLLRIAVRNLLDNAIRHGRAEGEGARIEVAVGPDRVEVADRGPGPPPVSAAGFHRFREATPGGTGLGLSISAWVADAHGGELTLEPRPRGGTVARLTLAACG